MTRIAQRLASRVSTGAGIFLFCALPTLTCAQSATTGATPTRHAGPISGPAQRAPGLEDDFAGLHYTDEQKANIQLIQKDSKLRKDTVLHDTNLSPDQRNAMLQGLSRIERGQIYKILTPEQQTEVRKRVLARREALAKERQTQAAHQQPLSMPAAQR